MSEWEAAIELNPIHSPIGSQLEKQAKKTWIYFQL